MLENTCSPPKIKRMIALKARKAMASVAVKLRAVRGFLILVFMVSLTSFVA
jgi:hypothetical protein